MKDDYKKLLGAELWYVMSDGTTYRGFVAGIDYKVGITVLDKDNPKHELVCLNTEAGYYHPYDDMFDFNVLCIGMGIISVKDTNEIFPIPQMTQMFGTMAQCAFK